jgi:DNA-3-methyladenine glycosylase I
MSIRLAPGLVRGDDAVVRCAWGSADPLYRAYHEEEWGRPGRDDVRAAIGEHGLASGLLVGTYERPDTSIRADSPQGVVA